MTDFRLATRPRHIALPYFTAAVFCDGRPLRQPFITMAVDHEVALTGAVWPYSKHVDLTNHRRHTSTDMRGKYALSIAAANLLNGSIDASQVQGSVGRQSSIWPQEGVLRPPGLVHASVKT